MRSLLLAVWTSLASSEAVLPAALSAAFSTPHVKYYDTLVESLPTLHGKVVAITGTTSGLGYWAAIATAKKSPACLLMLNRESNRSVRAEEEIQKQAASGVIVKTVHCDLENVSSVRAAAAEVNSLAASFGGLDVLALNAGIMSQPDVRTMDGYDVMMQTNHLSHFLLTKLLMPSLRKAAVTRSEVRIVTHSSLTRGRSKLWEGGGPLDEKYFVRSEAGSLGGDGHSAARERYHQSKLANIAFAMALRQRLATTRCCSGFKALSAAPGFADTNLKIPKSIDHNWIKDLVALSAPDGSCSLLTAMFSPAAESGDFFEPERLSTGPPIQVIAKGSVLPPRFPRGIVGIRDKEVCDNATLAYVWHASEHGLGEKFIVDGPEPTILV